MPPQAYSSNGNGKRYRSVIDLEDVCVAYGSFQALKGVSLAIPEGATGLVGRNGAGKSTLLKLLLGLIRAKSGSGQVLGVPISASGARLRSLVGYMPEGDALLPGMRGVEQVALAGELCSLTRQESIRRAHEVLGYVGLGEARYRNVEAYSTGMKQRLKLAVALVHDPALLLLDEPTVGLDPPGRARMLDLIADLVQKHGKSLLICTHLLTDIQHTCEHVVMIDEGTVMAAGPLHTVLGHDASRVRLQWDGNGAEFLDRLRQVGVTVEEKERGKGGTIDPLVDGEAYAATPPDFDSAQFFHLAFETGVRIRTLDVEFGELGDLYHRLIEQREKGHVRSSG